MQKSLKNKLKNIPQNPGVYLFLNKSKEVLYVGKAKNLKKRISTYFQINKVGRRAPARLPYGTSLNGGRSPACRRGREIAHQPISKNIAPDKLLLLSQTANLDYIITDTEAEALLLESTLIKKHHPRFNIILKDDKNYLYLKINLKDDWPTLTTIRRPNFKDKNFYAGPYPSADPARQTLKLLARIFKFCTCKNFTKKPCLRFKLGWCLCPAQTKIKNNDYRKIFTHVIKFLKGRTGEVIKELKCEMKKASAKKRYEDAARFRDSIRAIQKTVSQQKVISTKNENYDVISLAREVDLACVNMFTIREGKLINKQNFILEHTKHSTDVEIIQSFINQHYTQTSNIPKEILVPTKIKTLIPNDSWLMTVPIRGKKHQLLTLGQQNAQNYLKQQLNNVTMRQCNNETINELKKTLHLPTLPKRIEAYDISNIQGVHATGSLVVFTNGQPDKSQYRRFKIRLVGGLRTPTIADARKRWALARLPARQGDRPPTTITKPNDVAMLQQVISRRLKNKSWPLPDLILLDGGKPQLNAATKVLSTINDQQSTILLIALAKQEEQIFLPNKKHPKGIPSGPLILPPTSPILQLLQRIRDEAHRFSHAYYLKQHKKSQTHSALNDIPGLGKKTRNKLLKNFGSVEKVKQTSFKELEKIVGKKMAQKIKKYL